MNNQRPQALGTEPRHDVDDHRWQALGMTRCAEPLTGWQLPTGPGQRLLALDRGGWWIVMLAENWTGRGQRTNSGLKWFARHPHAEAAWLACDTWLHRQGRRAS